MRWVRLIPRNDGRDESDDGDFVDLHKSMYDSAISLVPRISTRFLDHEWLERKLEVFRELAPPYEMRGGGRAEEGYLCGLMDVM